MEQLVILVGTYSTQSIAKCVKKDCSVFDLGQNTIPKNLKLVESRLDEDEILKIQKEVLSKLNKFGEESLVKALSFKNSSVFYYHKFRVYYNVVKTVTQIKEIEAQINEGVSIKLISKSKEVANHFQNNNGVIVDQVENNSPSSISWNSFAYLFCFASRAFVGLFQHRRLYKGKTIVLDRSEHYEKNMLSTDGVKREQHPNMSPIQRELANTCVVLDELPIYSIRNNKFKNQKKYWMNLFNRNMVFGEFLIVKNWFSKKIKADVQENLNRLNSNLQVVANNVDSSRYVEQMIVSLYASLSSTTKIYLYKELIYSTLFAKYRPLSVMSSDENSVTNRVVFNAAKENSVKTIGIQHGAIGVTSPNYMYTKHDMGYSAVPDVTLVWGEYWKGIMVNEGNYPADQVKVVGQIRTDVISLLNKSSEKLNPRVVLFATQPIPDASYRERAMNDFFQLATSFPDVQFIIKPHPRELDKEFFESRLHSHIHSNVLIERKEDLYVLLSKVDLLLTCYSTVAVEALYFNKPVLLIDYNSLDMLGFGAKKLAPICTSYEMLYAQFEKLSAGKIIANEEVTHYVSDVAYKIDGQVINRVIAEIRGAN